jgi:hypothetical protein
LGESWAAIVEEPPLKEPETQETELSAAESQPPEDESEPTFATRTIAELYLRQGLKAKAVRVLRKILREDEANLWARETLQELESDEIVLPARPQPSNRSSLLKKRAKALELMLARVRLMKRLGA